MKLRVIGLVVVVLMQAVGVAAGTWWWGSRPIAAPELSTPPPASTSMASANGDEHPWGHSDYGCIRPISSPSALMVRSVLSLMRAIASSYTSDSARLATTITIATSPAAVT